MSSHDPQDAMRPLSQEQSYQHRGSGSGSGMVVVADGTGAPRDGMSLFALSNHQPSQQILRLDLRFELIAAGATLGHPTARDNKR